MTLRISSDSDEARELLDALETALARGLARQFDSLEELAGQVPRLVEPTALRAKITEFLRPGGGIGSGAPLYVWALVPPSRHLRAETWQAIEVTIGGRPGVALLVVMSRAEIATVAKKLRKRAR
jgi:hypothetical protein